jgi:hypothetical protein
MNKKNITIIVATTGLVLLIAAGIAVNNYVTSFRKVAIHVERAGLTADVYKADFAAEEGASTDNSKIASINGSQTLSLQAGSYYITPTTKTIDPSPIAFSVGQTDISVTVNPGLSKEHLASLVAKEQPAAIAVLTAKYPQLSNFTLGDGKLYQNGEWYGISMTQKVQPTDVGDIYRTVLHKVNGKWEIVATPQLVLTSDANKNIPVDILRDVNLMQSGSEDE